jgi:hypothetical protein
MGVKVAALTSGAMASSPYKISSNQFKLFGGTDTYRLAILKAYFHFWRVG